MLLELPRGNRGRDYEFVKEWTVEPGAVARKGCDLAESVMGFVEAEFAEFAEALLAECRQENGCSYGQQRLVSADIGSGAFAANMLLSGLQSQHIAGLFLGTLFDRLPDEPAWQQAHIFAARGHEAQRRTTVAHGI